MNYATKSEIGSDFMKPLERIFFIACINEQRRVLSLADREFSVRNIGNIFERLGFSYKQLMSYVKKWFTLGFYEYGITLDLGWFNFAKLKGEYLTIYTTTEISSHWSEGEFSQYIVKEIHKNKTITNYAMRNLYGIGQDDRFYGSEDCMCDFCEKRKNLKPYTAFRVEEYAGVWL